MNALRQAGIVIGAFGALILLLTFNENWVEEIVFSLLGKMDYNVVGKIHTYGPIVGGIILFIGVVLIAVGLSNVKTRQV